MSQTGSPTNDRSVFAVVRPSLAPPLIAPEAVPWLDRLAGAIPTSSAIGFECRLDAADSQVDLQFGSRHDDEQPAALLAALDRAAPDSAVWGAVRELCQQWSTAASAAADSILELWLEFDRPDGETARLAELTPSVFAVFRAGGGEHAAARRVTQLLVDGHEPLLGVLDRCVAACPPRGRLTAVGVMTGRALPVARVEFGDIPLDQVSTYLHDVGWTGDVHAAHDQMRQLLVFCDRAVLSFDVIGDTLLPRLGLAAYFSQLEGLDPRWPPLLDRLVRLGFADREKASALLRWPGVTLPRDAIESWPDHLIVESMRRPADMFGTIERRLSHVKLTLSGDAPVTAKAYFGCGAVWSRYRDADGGGEPAFDTGVGSRDLASSVDAALDWLLSRRNQGGWWRDFFDRGRPKDVDRRVTGYASDEWVTAYVATVLANVGRPQARRAAATALELLHGRRDAEPGWGYHSLLPPDADTTTWVLRLSRDLGEPRTDRITAAERFVRALVGPSGGVSTYPPQAADQLAQFLQMFASYDGWCATHTCVTAAAAALDIDRNMVEFLRREQRSDGSWAGHWWDDDEYTTARAVEVLAGVDEDAVRRAVEWAAGRVGEDGAVHPSDAERGSEFATALAVQVMLASPATASAADALRHAVRWLRAMQGDDGSWRASARLRVPAPDTVDPLASPETTLTYVDDDRVFTTATVLASLAGVAGSAVAAGM